MQKTPIELMRINDGDGPKANEEHGARCLRVRPAKTWKGSFSGISFTLVASMMSKQGFKYRYGFQNWSLPVSPKIMERDRKSIQIQNSKFGEFLFKKSLKPIENLGKPVENHGRGCGGDE
jgi:hypothetical protein